MGYRVLVVDDEEEVVEILAEFLMEEGFEVVGSRSAEEALAIFRKDDVDLVVTDVRMPGIDGVEMAKEMRERKPDIPIIFVSAYVDFSELKGMIEGSFSFFHKPFDLSDILEEVRRYLFRGGEGICWKG
jgi:DNA-binding NtrC family response regulator